MTLNIGDIVKHENPYHVRGASRGAIELITTFGYQVYWEEDEVQITPAFRTYSESELELVRV